MRRRTHKIDGDGNDARAPLRIPRSTLAEIDRVAGRGGRSRWIRDAIDAALAAERVRTRRAELDAALARMKRPGGFWESDDV